MHAVYVIARNNSGRPTLQHALSGGTASQTLCGTDVTHWSRGFQSRPIPEVLCLRCSAVMHSSKKEPKVRFLPTSLAVAN